MSTMFSVFNFTITSLSSSLWQAFVSACDDLKIFLFNNQTPRQPAQACAVEEQIFGKYCLPGEQRISRSNENNEHGWVICFSPFWGQYFQWKYLAVANASLWVASGSNPFFEEWSSNDERLRRIQTKRRSLVSCKSQRAFNLGPNP